jgi:hypothetical protein
MIEGINGPTVRYPFRIWQGKLMVIIERECASVEGSDGIKKEEFVSEIGRKD